MEAQTGVPASDVTLAYAPPPTTLISVELPAAMHATHGPTVTLAVDPVTETVADVKARVQKQTGVAPSEQTLSYDGSPMSDGALTLGSYGVQSGEAVAAAIPNPPSALPFSVKVQMPSSLRALYGASITIPTSSSETVDDVKAAVQAITGMSAVEQQLAFGSLPLTSDTQTLGGAGIESGDTVKLTTPSPSVTVTLPPELHSTFGPSVTVAAGPRAKGATMAAGPIR